MHCSEYIKSEGLKSLTYVVQKSGIPESTLKVWYIKKLFLFNAVLEKVKRDNRCGDCINNNSLQVSPFSDFRKCNECKYEPRYIDNYKKRW